MEVETAGRVGQRRTVEVLFERQSDTKSLKAAENCPSRTGGLAFGMRNRTRIATSGADDIN
jgi:hypothetical protein